MLSSVLARWAVRSLLPAGAKRPGESWVTTVTAGSALRWRGAGPAGATDPAVAAVTDETGGGPVAAVTTDPAGGE